MTALEVASLFLSSKTVSITVPTSQSWNLISGGIASNTFFIFGASDLNQT